MTSEELFATSDDFARFGELMHNNGRASNGRQVVSAARERETATMTTCAGQSATTSADTSPTRRR